ncbi:unnamed protein product [Ilex paraguariensis]|uniref:Transmembrane protein n=1 Tax=Ilex paraguariensis TaxID=185542 RepID=A0ABC8V1Y9_9AQUA
MMAHVDSSGSDLDIDLESGGTTSEEDVVRKDRDLSGEDANKLLGRVCNGFMGLEGSIRNVDGLISYDKMLNTDEISIHSTEILSDKIGEQVINSVDKKKGNVKQKNPIFKKPPKPPRPPRGLPLDAADIKLVKEISELAMLKRRRIERMKALKKMKAQKGTSFNSNLFAMAITILFCLIIFFQGEENWQATDVPLLRL